MPLYDIEIQIDARYADVARPELLDLAATATLDGQQVEGPIELSLIVMGDEEVHALNLRHRGVDATTDVLAFPNTDCEPFVARPGSSRYLGDVIVSFPRAAAQAEEAGHGIGAELQLLVVHGVLHLLGYDDVAAEQRARMWREQEVALRSLGVEVNLPVWE